MSKINKIRIVNLNYNNNNFKINDEMFYLNNENTLFNLRNGGGKSVLVQMITAPFVRGKYRKTSDRPFESYFTTGTPSYILVEWKLEHEAGFLLTGMMVRKKESSSDENSKEKLDIINFVNEYREENDFDIEKIEIVEEDSRSKKVKSFGNTKKLFEDLKKNRNVKFNYYDMNNYKTSRDYFNKLLEYGIDHKEWEDIIKKINVKESGLSELFNDSKDTTGLIKKWFLPTIENKLDKDESRIRNYRTLIESYVKQYKKNKADIEKKEKIEIFNTLSEGLFKISEEGINNILEKERLENIIKNTLLKLEKNIEEREGREKCLEEEKERLIEKIEELNYEKLSIEIYKNEEEKESLKEKLEELEDNIKEVNKEEEDALKKQCILECAKIYKIYTKYSKELQEIENQLEVLRNKSKDSKEEVLNLGYTLKLITKEELDILKKEFLEIKEKEKSIEEDKSKIEKSLENDREYIRSLESNKGGYRAKIDGFSTKESKLNRIYNFDITRNIEGLLDEKVLLEIDEDIRNEKIELSKRKKETRENVIALEKEENDRKNEREKIREEINKIKFTLENKKETFEDLNKDLTERRDILKFIDFNEDRIFESEEIKREFNKKLESFRNDIKICEDAKEKELKEVKKLKTGNIINIPKEVLSRLKEKDIKIIYGLEWLKKNGNSEKDNIDIVNKNPFIPYSLIMEKREIEVLKEDDFNFFTSNPISIIDREELRQGLEKNKGKVIDIPGVKFLISFNNKLLNEKELLEIIRLKEENIKNLEEKINEKKEVIGLYDEKLTKIKISELSLELYEEIKNTIENLTVREKEIKETALYLDKEIGRLSEEIKDKEKKILSLNKSEDFNEKKREEFYEFKEEYKRYVEHKEKLLEVEEKIKLINKGIKNNEENSKRLNNIIKELLGEINKYNNLKEEKEKEYFDYDSYQDGIRIQKDKEDVLARFKALTVEITSSETELMQKKSEKKSEYIDIEKELIAKADEYELKEKDYRDEAYNSIKEKEIKKLIREIKDKEKNLNKEYNKIDKDIAVSEAEIKNLYKKLNEECKKEEPKEKRNLIEKNFKEEVNKVSIDIKALEREKKDLKKEKEKLNNALGSLNEYKILELKEELDFKININNIYDEGAKLKRDLNNIEKKINKNAIKLKDEMVEIEISEEFKGELFFKDSIETLKKLNDNPKIFVEQLKNILEAYKLMLEKLAADIEVIQKEEEKIILNLLEYIEEVHINIGKIDDNSTIEIKGRKLKMLNINIRNFEEERESYKVRLKGCIEGIRDRALDILKKNENIEDIISTHISTIKLYDEVIGIGTIEIKLYKIEEDRQRKISWQEVSKNSGGEGFLSAFVILSSLLSYIRRDENDIFTKNEEGKVLVMDNPFAQTNAAHLLKPLMDIAKKSNTQLICLTGLNGESIYNRFDNIYVLSLVNSRFKEGIKNLKKEHIKGIEEAEVISSRFKLEDQIKLF